MILICIVILLIAVYLLVISGRSGHRGLPALRGWYYAHRGLHGNGVPENSMAAFREALERGCGIELDIHLMKDGNLAVIHDASLKRTAGADVKIEDLTREQLQSYRLEGTQETIPLFSQVLELFRGKAPMIIELKSEGNNHDALVTAAVKAMEGYEGIWCMESFDPRCIRSLKQRFPHVIRGQLSENFLKSPGLKAPKILKWVMTWLLPNFLTQPDFIAYRFSDRKMLSNRLCCGLWGLQEVSWTLKTQQELDAAVAAGCIPIFEGFLPENKTK